MSPSKIKIKIAVVICSNRPRRLNPYIATYIQQTIASNWPLPQTNPSSESERITEPTIEIIDLALQALPLYDEPEVPSYLPAQDPTSHYVHAHTRAWSALVRRYDAFVFVTPQYNWSVPAVLKNALDYLYHEWTGKPAGIVSYGGRGGGKAAEHLRGILAGLRMRPAATAAALKVSTKTAIENCEREGGQVTTAMRKTWTEEGEEQKIQVMFSELLQLV